MKRLRKVLPLAFGATGKFQRDRYGGFCNPHVAEMEEGETVKYLLAVIIGLLISVAYVFGQ